MGAEIAKITKIAKITQIEGAVRGSPIRKERWSGLLCEAAPSSHAFKNPPPQTKWSEDMNHQRDGPRTPPRSETGVGVKTTPNHSLSRWINCVTGSDTKALSGN